MLVLFFFFWEKIYACKVVYMPLMLLKDYLELNLQLKFVDIVIAKTHALD